MRISDGEYRQRLARLGAAVEEAGLDVFVVSAFDCIYYLTGAGFEPLERPFFLLVYPGNREAPRLLVPKLDEEHLKKARNIDQVHAYWDYPSPPGRGWPERLRALLGSARRVGVEPSLRMEIADELGGYEIGAHPLLEQLRLVKSPDEIRMIRRAADYAVMGARHLLDAAYPGATVAEAFARTSAVTRAMVRDVPDWEPLTSKVLMATWAAPRSAQPHSVPGLDDRLEKGPHIALVLTRVNGYAAECERTFFTAPPAPEVREAFEAMMEARRRAFAQIRPGVRGADLDAEVNAFLAQEGFGAEDRRLHRTGHGFGLGNHEAPWLAEGSSEVLEAGMVISIEPGVYLPGRGGLRHSDTVLVTDDGFETPTDMPTSLDRLMRRRATPLQRLKGRLVRRALGL